MGTIKNMEQNIKEFFTEKYSKSNDLFNNDTNVVFMNHGYYPIDDRVADLFLNTSASLYCHLMDKLQKQSGENILDIGCGRGGGTQIIKQYYNFKNVFGCDYNAENINHCKLLFPEINFTRDNAEILNNYSSGLFDCVVNVESSHCYDNITKFLRSVRRVLKDDGTFLFADLFRVSEINLNQIENKFSKFFRIENITDITENVILSCEYMSDKISEHMRREKSDKYKTLYNVYFSHMNAYRNNIDKFYVFILKKPS